MAKTSAALVRRTRPLALACGLLCAATLAYAQPSALSPKVGVVLSGGSAKGFAHVGVLRVLEGAGIPIDVVTGTSMGSLVGGLYAIGYTPDEIEQVAVSQKWEALFSDPSGPAFFAQSGRPLHTRTVISFPLQNGRVQLPSGLVPGQEISRLLSRLTWPALGIDDFRQLPIPFAAVATDIESGQAVVLDRGSLPLALRASMSLPGVFRPVSIENHLLVDGGIVRNLPSAEAKALGADVLICSDVSEPPLAAENLRSFLDVLLQTVSFQMEASTVEQRRLCDVLIRPDIEGMSSTAFDRARDWIERGERAAQETLPAVTKATQAAEFGPRPARSPVSQARSIDRVEVRGLSEEGLRFAERVLGLNVPATLTPDDLDDAIDRLYRTGAFDRVMYRLEGGRDNGTLVIDASQRSTHSLGFGFRYDSRFKASLLFDATLHNVGRFGSTTRVGMRLGEQFELSGQHLLRAGTASGLITGFDASYVETPISIFVDGARVAEAKVEVANLSGFVGARLGQRALASVRLTGEHARGGTRIAVVEAGDARTFYTVSGTLAVDTLDRHDFPHRGVRLLGRSEAAHTRIGSGGTFWLHRVEAESAVPLTPRLTFLTRGLAGAAGGADLPFHYQFFLGGTIPSAVFTERQPTFPGLRAQERAGRAVQLLQAGLQFEPADRLFVTVMANVGNTADQWTIAFDDYRKGYEVAVGALTFLGPLEIVGSGGKLSDRPTIEFRLGHRF